MQFLHACAIVVATMSERIDGIDRFKVELVALLPRLRRFAGSLSRTPESADELVQAACERALSRFHQWAPGSRLDSWVYTIMRSIWQNQMRSERVRAGTGTVDAERQIGDNGTDAAESRLLFGQVGRRSRSCRRSSGRRSCSSVWKATVTRRSPRL